MEETKGLRIQEEGIGRASKTRKPEARRVSLEGKHVNGRPPCHDGSKAEARKIRHAHGRRCPPCELGAWSGFV